MFAVTNVVPASSAAGELHVSRIGNNPVKFWTTDSDVLTGGWRAKPAPVDDPATQKIRDRRCWESRNGNQSRFRKPSAEMRARVLYTLVTCSLFFPNNLQYRLNQTSCPLWEKFIHFYYERIVKEFNLFCIVTYVHIYKLRIYHNWYWKGLII